MGHSRQASYISQIENGRADVPSGDKLEKLLKIYGNVKLRRYQQLVRDYKVNSTALENINKLLPRLKEKDLGLILSMVEKMASESR